MSKRRKFDLSVQPKQPILDMLKLSEDDRCALIARVAADRRIVAFMVDDERDAAGEHKADRYVRKIQAVDPRLVELERLDGPVANVVTIRIGLPETEN